MSRRRSRIYETVLSLLAHTIASPRSREGRLIRSNAAKALIDLVQQDYIIKGLGGTDSTGIKWDLTKRFETDGPYMMILTGRLLKSLSFRTTHEGFELYFDTPYAKFALGKRPAWPDGSHPPASYIEVVQDSIRSTLSQLIEARLSEHFRVEARVS